MKHGREIYAVHGLLNFSWSDTCWERGIWRTDILTQVFSGCMLRNLV